MWPDTLVCPLSAVLKTSVSVRVLRLDETDTEYRRAILFGATFLHIVLV